MSDAGSDAGEQPDGPGCNDDDDGHGPDVDDLVDDAVGGVVDGLAAGDAGGHIDVPAPPADVVPVVDAAGNIYWHSPSGSLVFYRNSGQVYAYCDDPRHGGRGICRKSKTSAPGRKAGQGRPCGLLLAWLWQHVDADTRELHKHSVPEWEDRIHARQVLADTVAGRLLLEQEAPKGDAADDSEPEVIA